MNEVPVVVWIGVAMAVVHMALCHVLLERVKRENATMFEKMGAFHLFWNNTPGSTWLFWKWLCSSGASNLSVGTRILTWAVRLLTVVFLGWFLVQIGSIFWS